MNATTLCVVVGVAAAVILLLQFGTGGGGGDGGSGSPDVADEVNDGASVADSVSKGD